MIQIDQSIKIEQTSQDTVLGMSNTCKRTIVIPAKVKQEAFILLKNQGKSHDIACYEIFAIGIFILLKPYLANTIRQGEYIVIDTEYTGQEAKIKSVLLQFMKLHGFKISKDQIFFDQVGKASGAHQIAWRVQRKKEKADYIVRLEEMLHLLGK